MRNRIRLPPVDSGGFGAALAHHWRIGQRLARAESTYIFLSTIRYPPDTRIGLCDAQGHASTNNSLRLGVGHDSIGG